MPTASWIFFIVLGIVIGVVAMVHSHLEEKKLASMGEGERTRYLAEKEAQKTAQEAARKDALASLNLGTVNPMIICPQCQNKGAVRTKSVQHKSGISGGKATAALLTGGVSMLATGLSRKEAVTQAHCDNCNSTWHF